MLTVGVLDNLKRVPVAEAVVVVVVVVLVVAGSLLLPLLLAWTPRGPVAPVAPVAPLLPANRINYRHSHHQQLNLAACQIYRLVHC